MENAPPKERVSFPSVVKEPEKTAALAEKLPGPGSDRNSGTKILSGPPETLSSGGKRFSSPGKVTGSKIDLFSPPQWLRTGSYPAFAGERKPFPDGFLENLDPIDFKLFPKTLSRGEKGFPLDQKTFS